MKNPIVRGIVATIAGLIAGGLVVFAIEMLAIQLYPMPPGMNQNDPDEMAIWIQTLPTGAFLFILAAYFFGTLGGSWTATKIGRSIWPGIIVALLLFGGAVMNLVKIPHPSWMWVAVPVVYIAAALLGIRLARTRRTMHTA